MTNIRIYSITETVNIEYREVLYTARIRAVAYCRVSTDGQVGEDKYGIESQKRDIAEYCEKHNIEIVQWYVDEGISGAKDDRDRPELRKILNGEVTNPPIKAVVVAKSDRLSREIEQYYWFKYTFKRNNINLISVAEDFGSAGKLAPIYEAVTAVFAQMEREMIAARMGGGRQIKAARGGYSGGKPPYGYSAERGSRVLTVNEDEAKLVRRIFELRDKKKVTMQGICNALKADGYKTRSGGDFQTSTVQYILGNRKMYEGYYKYGGSDDWVKGVHEPILKDDVE